MGFTLVLHQNNQFLFNTDKPENIIMSHITFTNFFCPENQDSTALKLSLHDLAFLKTINTVLAVQ